MQAGCNKTDHVKGGSIHCYVHGMQASNCTLSKSMLGDHDLHAMILVQDNPECIMVSESPSGRQPLVERSPNSPNKDSHSNDGMEPHCQQHGDHVHLHLSFIFCQACFVTWPLYLDMYFGVSCPNSNNATLTLVQTRFVMQIVWG